MTLQLITKTPEVKLMQLLHELRPMVAGWQAVHFHLSRLLEEYKSEYQIKIALNLAYDSLRHYEGAVLLLSDSSILVLCRHVEPPVMEKLIFQLRYLFMDDPLAYTETGEDNIDFCSVYDLRQHWQSFYDLCLRRMAVVTRKQPLAFQPLPDKKPGASEVKVAVLDRPMPKLMSDPPPPPAFELKQEAAHHLSASKLAVIERDLRHVDLAKTVRRQPVCAVLKDMQVRRVFDELYIHISHLRQLLHPEVDLFSNRWLFKYITKMLDERMLEILQAGAKQYLSGAVSLNLNVETLLSTRFADFDAQLTPASKVGIVLEIPVVDVFADMSAFLMVRAEVQKLGYRVCLDGLTVDSFASINREGLGVDLLKVQWNSDMLVDLQQKTQPNMVEAVRAAGGNRVILCRCDNQHAIEYGQALGISLFQGRFLDAVLNPTSKVEN